MNLLPGSNVLRSGSVAENAAALERNLHNGLPQAVAAMEGRVSAWATPAGRAGGPICG